MEKGAASSVDRGSFAPRLLSSLYRSPPPIGEERIQGRKRFAFNEALFRCCELGTEFGGGRRVLKSRNAVPALPKKLLCQFKCESKVFRSLVSAKASHSMEAST